MDITTAVGAAKATNWVIQFWKNLWKKDELMAINSPLNHQVMPQPWVEFRGTHTNLTQAYWLLTHDGNKFWPQCRIRPRADGQWVERVNVNEKPEDREHSVILAKTSPFCDKVLEEWKIKSENSNNWDPINLFFTIGQFERIQGVLVHVKGSGK